MNWLTINITCSKRKNSQVCYIIRKIEWKPGLQELKCIGSRCIILQTNYCVCIRISSWEMTMLPNCPYDEFLDQSWVRWQCRTSGVATEWQWDGNGLTLVSNAFFSIHLNEQTVRSVWPGSEPFLSRNAAICFIPLLFTSFLLRCRTTSVKFHITSKTKKI